jgi:4'-phosphopantetheinyl transferase
MESPDIDSAKLTQTQRVPGSQEVHIWLLSLNRPDLVEKFAAELTADETARAARFRLARVRDQFILARGWLRTILGRYLQLPARDVVIAYESGGKPYLPGHPFHFNLSHSGDRALIGVALRRIGVDVEQRREMPNAQSLVERYFSPQEQRAFFSVPPEERLNAFYRGWTRKEAILKAIGSGVQALEDCEVSLHPTEPTKLFRLETDLQASEKWFLHGWDAGDGYEAAAAVEREDDKMTR